MTRPEELSGEGGRGGERTGASHQSSEMIRGFNAPAGTPTEGDALNGHKHGVWGSGSRPEGGKRQTGTSWNDIIASVAILSVAAALVLVSWTMRRHQQSGAVDWNEASAYPFVPLRLKPYDTADVVHPKP